MGENPALIALKEVASTVTKPVSRLFTALVVAALLLCSATVVFSTFHEAAVVKEIANLQTNLEAVQGRLRKQQQEYAQYQEELPLVLAQVAEVQPQADAAYTQEQALRQQRKDLRAENSALADELSALLAQAEDANADALLTAQAIEHLSAALADIAALYGLE